MWLLMTLLWNIKGHLSVKLDKYRHLLKFRKKIKGHL